MRHLIWWDSKNIVIWLPAYGTESRYRDLRMYRNVRCYCTCCQDWSVKGQPTYCNLVGMYPPTRLVMYCQRYLYCLLPRQPQVNRSVFGKQLFVSTVLAVCWLGGLIISFFSTWCWWGQLFTMWDLGFAKGGSANPGEGRKPCHASYVPRHPLPLIKYKEFNCGWQTYFLGYICLHLGKVKGKPNYLLAAPAIYPWMDRQPSPDDNVKTWLFIGKFW